MRTTLDIDEDVLAAVKEISQQQKKSAGKVISQLLRASFTGKTKSSVKETVNDVETVAGFRPIRRENASIVTNEIVNQLREEEGI